MVLCTLPVHNTICARDNPSCLMIDSQEIGDSEHGTAALKIGPHFLKEKLTIGT